MFTKKFALAAASSMLAATLVFAAAGQPAFAASKVDCDAVMSELNSGKHEKEVAKDLNTTLYQVRKCKRHAKEAARASTKSRVQASAMAAMPSPAMAGAAPSAAMAKPAASMAAPAAASSK